MIIVTEKEYWSEKAGFLKEHPIDKIITSSMDEYGNWHKEYICEDGEAWYESYSHVYEKADVEIEIKKCKIVQSIGVNLFRTEYWNSVDGFSSVMYEKE